MTEETRTTSAPSQHTRLIKKTLGWTLSLMVIAGVFAAFAWLNRTTPQHASAKPIWYEAPEKQTAPKPQLKKLPSPVVAAAPVSPADKTRALTQLARIDRVLRDYKRIYSEFPIGSNIDITRTLRGDNPKKIIFVTPEEAPISARGELIDAWQTPYFFHQLSGTTMEIFSPGPDRQMWTADDLKVTAQ